MALVAGLGWASGMRLYALLFFLGVIHHVGAASLPTSLQLLAHPAVMAASGTLFVTEFFADKVPGFDTLWDALHTFVRIPAGALLAAFRRRGRRSRLRRRRRAPPAASVPGRGMRLIKDYCLMDLFTIAMRPLGRCDAQ